MTDLAIMATVTNPGTGPSGVAIATLVIAGVGSFGAAGVAVAALVQAHGSKVAAKEAADAARDLARIAGDARKDATALAARLAGRSSISDGGVAPFKRHSLIS